MSDPSATPAAAPVSDAAMTASLIREITAEARSTGQSLVFDPEAPPELFDDAGAPKLTPKAKPPARATDGKAPPKEQSDAQDPEADEIDQDGEELDAEDGDEADKTPVTLDAEAIKRALKAEGGVDMLALAQALGVDPETLKVTGAQHRVLRLQQSKAKRMIAKAHDLSKRLNDTYGDQVKARKAVGEGDLNTAIAFVEGTFGMNWNELNRAVGQLLQGKPVADLEQKRELQELRKKEAARADAEKQATEARAKDQKVADAKTWISTQLKGDKLATPELNKQLSEAGFPTIADLVFEEMAANYSKGLTDPKKALERVKAKLTKQARALQATGLLGKAPAPAKSTPLSNAKPRSSAQTGSAGTARPMTDAELRAAVLKEAGLYR